MPETSENPCTCSLLDSKVLRTKRYAKYLWRRLECKKCGGVFTTTERKNASARTNVAPTLEGVGITEHRDSNAADLR